MTALEFGFAIQEMTHSLKPFAFKLTKDQEEAKDLLQETVLKAFVNREKFARGTNLKAWLYTIMKNTFITAYQRKQRHNTFVDTTDNLHFLNSSNHVARNGAYTKFAMDDINQEISNLNESYKVPFMMHYKGFKYHEIADHLGIPIGTVKNRIHIARTELKTKLKVYKAA